MSWTWPSNQRLKLTGAAIQVFRASKSLQVAPAAYPSVRRTTGKANKMRRPWLWAFLLGVTLGAGGGVGLSWWALSTPPARGSALLNNFSFQELTQQAGHPAWEVVEDKTYSPLPPLGRPKRIQRRIVAHATLSDEQLAAFVGNLDGAIESVLQQFAAHQTGEHQRFLGQVDSSGRSELQLPRYYYVIGQTQGVLDPWLIAHHGRAIVIVCITE